MYSPFVSPVLGEPILVEAAACIMNSYLLVENKANPLPEFVDFLQSELSLGQVDRGRNGALTARLLRMQSLGCFLTSVILAKDQATRELWWDDQRFLAIVNERPGKRFLNPHNEGNRKYFREFDLYYHRPPSPIAFYHRA